jgi:hypothetical protein
VKGAADGSDLVIFRRSAAAESDILSEPGWAQSAKRKLSLLQFAEEFGNVAKACKIMGYHRDTFSELRLAGTEVGPSGVHGGDASVTAADLLYDRVLPLYEALGVTIGAILTDNGRWFCGIQERHQYELLPTAA